MMFGMTTAGLVSQPWKPRDTLANRLRLLRAELDLSQREFGQQCEIPPHQIQSIEDGKSPRQLDIKIKKIVKAFGVDRDWLMWGGDLADPDSPGPDDGCPHQDSNLGPADYQTVGHVLPFRKTSHDDNHAAAA